MSSESNPANKQTGMFANELQLMFAIWQLTSVGMSGCGQVCPHFDIFPHQNSSEDRL